MEPAVSPVRVVVAAIDKPLPPIRQPIDPKDQVNSPEAVSGIEMFGTVVPRVTEDAGRKKICNQATAALLLNRLMAPTWSLKLPAVDGPRSVAVPVF